MVEDIKWMETDRQVVETSTSPPFVKSLVPKMILMIKVNGKWREAGSEMLPPKPSNN